jgi:energy-coupling factor transporter transmembrane protein EcfT
LSPFKRKRAIEIVALSGVVRVTFNPKPAWLALCLGVPAIILLAAATILGWAWLALWYLVLLACVILSVAHAIYRMSGTEIIEFDAKRLAIHKHVLGWDRTREYPIDECSDLKYREQGGGSGELRCTLGWRTIGFAKRISEDEASEVFAALQAALPNVAQRMLLPSKYLTTLNLG